MQRGLVELLPGGRGEEAVQPRTLAALHRRGLIWAPPLPSDPTPIRLTTTGSIAASWLRIHLPDGNGPRKPRRQDHQHGDDGASK
jgi:hypothetical protein